MSARSSTRRTRLVALSLCLLLLSAIVGGCSYRTAGAPRGDLTLHATFDDVNDLVVGHSVQIADVTVGSITDIELRGHQAYVTMSLDDEVPIPRETVAVLAQTSLLGENYVDLRFPPDADFEDALASGDEVATTDVQPPFEFVTEQAIAVIGALAAEDLDTIVSTGAAAFGGRGGDLREVLDQLGSVVATYEDQTGELSTIIDGFGQLGEDLAAGDDDVTALLDGVAAASVTLAENRDRIVDALDELTRLAGVTNDAVLRPHAEALEGMLAQLAPIVRTLADNHDILEGLSVNVDRFTADIIRNVFRGGQTQYAWLKGAVALEPPPGSNAPADADPAAPTPADQLRALLEPAS